jgi:hypothetical protein
MGIDKNYKFGLLILAIWLLPFLAIAQENVDTQNKPDYWCPKIEFADKTAKILKLEKCEYISGITVKLIYNGKYSYPSRLKFTLLDSHGNVIKENQKKKVFGPQSLKKGQYGIYTIQSYGNNNLSRIRIEGIW